MEIKNRLKRSCNGNTMPGKTCLMIGGSGMADVWIKNFADNFSELKSSRVDVKRYYGARGSRSLVQRVTTKITQG